jgi:hypothetical protein
MTGPDELCTLPTISLDVFVFGWFVLFFQTCPKYFSNISQILLFSCSRILNPFPNRYKTVRFVVVVFVRLPAGPGALRTLPNICLELYLFVWQFCAFAKQYFSIVSQIFLVLANRSQMLLVFSNPSQIFIFSISRFLKYFSFVSQTFRLCDRLCCVNGCPPARVHKGPC